MVLDLKESSVKDKYWSKSSSLSTILTKVWDK